MGGASIRVGGAAFFFPGPFVSQLVVADSCPRPGNLDVDQFVAGFLDDTNCPVHLSCDVGYRKRSKHLPHETEEVSVYWVPHRLHDSMGGRAPPPPVRNI